MKKKNIYIPAVRRIIQALCFVFIPELFIQIFNSIKALVMFAIHQQGSLQSILPDIILLAAATVVTAAAGRFFCGWMCAFGSIGDLVYRFPRFAAGKKNPVRYITGNADRILKLIKYAVLAVFIILIWGFQIAAVPNGTDPWALFGMLVSFSSLPSAGTVIAGWGIAAVLLLAILTASFFVERFFCRYLCPLGAYFSLISRFRPFTIRKDRRNCGSCSLCTSKCSMGIKLSDTDRVTSGECISCMECIRYCPSANAHLDLDENKKNVIVAGTVSCALIAGSYYLGNIYGNATSSGASVSSGSASAAETVSGAYAYLADGTYTGTGMGFRGETAVQVSVQSGVITNINITSAADDSEYMNKASSAVISEMIAAQSADVDAVSGATYSSNGIISAVKNALSQDTSESATDQLSSSSESAEDSAAPDSQTADSVSSESTGNSAIAAASVADIADGTYKGSGTGLRGETDVTVTVKDGKIAEITVDSYQDDQEFFERAESTIIDEILAAQSVDVDAVSGATYSSNGIREAVADALDLSFTASTVQNSGHGGEGMGGGSGHAGGPR